MAWQGWVTLVITAAVLLSLAMSRVGPHLIMMAALTLLGALGILNATELLSGFSNSGLITVAAMFVVAAGVHQSGGVDLLADKVLGKPGGERSAISRILLPVLLLSGFLNNTPVVATLIPAVNTWARKIRVPASKLMIPLSYAAILGGTTTLIGTSTNLVVNGQYQALTQGEGFSLFAITWIGLPVAIAGGLFMVLFFPRWLPNRGEELAFGNLKEFTLEVCVAANGPLVGKTIVEAGLRNLQRIYLVEIIRQDTVLTAVSSEQTLQGEDRLVFAGDTQAISDLLRIKGITASSSNHDGETIIKANPERCLVEAVVSPHCAAVGTSIRDAQFRDRYGAAILAVARNGERIKGNLGTIQLAAGDTLLLEARPAFVSRQRYNKDFLLINDLEQQRPRHEKAYLAWAILLVLITAATFEWITMLNAALIGAALMIITGCCTASQAEKSLDLTVLITIAASFALGSAIQKTGLANLLAENIVQLSLGQAWLLLVLTYVAVSLLTETITNNAAALIMLPIVMSVTQQAGLNAEPFVLAIMMAASASFATPLGYQTNLMVYGPGNYRFSDFLKVGVPMNIFIGAITLSILLWRYPLQG
ncbi:SLC13 family permease [Halioxenophilus aromaticivorans]|uniref:SLC13 family permease n=1 Tax=Halioxenophilus aromaticivorans TaxID=1306992 RepID=A0AAV3U5E9_9ALTE